MRSGVAFALLLVLLIPSLSLLAGVMADPGVHVNTIPSGGPFLVGQEIYITYYTEYGEDGTAAVLITSDPDNPGAEIWSRDFQPISGGLAYDVTAPGLSTPGTYYVGVGLNPKDSAEIVYAYASFQVVGDAIRPTSVAIEPPTIDVTVGSVFEATIWIKGLPSAMMGFEFAIGWNHTLVEFVTATHDYAADRGWESKLLSGGEGGTDPGVFLFSATKRTQQTAWSIDAQWLIIRFRSLGEGASDIMCAGRMILESGGSMHSIVRTHVHSATMSTTAASITTTSGTTAAFTSQTAPTTVSQSTAAPTGSGPYTFMVSPTNLTIVLLAVIVIILVITLTRRKHLPPSPPPMSHLSQTQTRYCTSCGTPLQPGKTFCGSCGARAQ